MTKKILADFQMCILTNSRELISNILIVFQTHRSKCPNKTFLVPNLLFFLFCTIFCISANSRMLISSLTIVFQIYGPKYPNKVFLVPFFVFAVMVLADLLDFWYLDKLKGTDFKYEISSLKISV